MMRTYILLLLTTLLFSCKHQNDNVITMQASEKGRIVNGLKEGAWVEYDERGNIKQIKSYKKGKLYGGSVSFYPDGSVHVFGSYRNGVLNGPAIIFYANQNINLHDNYINGELNGFSHLYDKEGDVKQSLFYLDNKVVNTLLKNIKVIN